MGAPPQSPLLASARSSAQSAAAVSSALQQQFASELRLRLRLRPRLRLRSTHPVRRHPLCRRSALRSPAAAGRRSAYHFSFTSPLKWKCWTCLLCGKARSVLQTFFVPTISAFVTMKKPSWCPANVPFTIVPLKSWKVTSLPMRRSYGVFALSFSLSLLNLVLRLSSLPHVHRIVSSGAYLALRGAAAGVRRRRVDGLRINPIHSSLGSRFALPRRSSRAKPRSRPLSTRSAFSPAPAQLPGSPAPSDGRRPTER